MTFGKGIGVNALAVVSFIVFLTVNENPVDGALATDDLQSLINLFTHGMSGIILDRNANGRLRLRIGSRRGEEDRDSNKRTGSLSRSRDRELNEDHEDSEEEEENSVSNNGLTRLGSSGGIRYGISGSHINRIGLGSTQNGINSGSLSGFSSGSLISGANPGLQNAIGGCRGSCGANAPNGFNGLGTVSGSGINNFGLQNGLSGYAPGFPAQGFIGGGWRPL